MERQYVGIDLHRRRSTIVRMDDAGDVVSAVNLDNDPIAIALEVAKAGPDPEVAVEATYGWYWLVDSSPCASTPTPRRLVSVQRSTGSSPIRRLRRTCGASSVSGLPE